MARGRLYSTKTSTDRELNSCSEFIQLFHARLIAHLDDWGFLEGFPDEIKNLVMPYSKRPIKDFEKALSELHQKRLLIWYEVNGKQYLFFPTFDKHQPGLHKRTKQKYPYPPEWTPEKPENSDFPELPGTSRNFPEIPSQVKLREVKLREVKQIHPSAPTESENILVTPEEIYSAYPRKVDKKNAIGCMQTRIKQGATTEDLFSAAKNYAAHCLAMGTEPQFIKHPSTFFGAKEPWQEWIQGPPESERPNAERRLTSAPKSNIDPAEIAEWERSAICVDWDSS